jgi:hypothetical protein
LVVMIAPVRAITAASIWFLALRAWGAATYHVVNRHLLDSFGVAPTSPRHLEIARAFNDKAW